MIIIPTYNEKANIEELIRRIRAVLPATPIVFVDDSSPDQTALEIKKNQARDANIHLLSRAKKMGFASAYKDGYSEFFYKINPDFVITMDADLSHPPEVLPQMIEALEQNDLCIGSRYVKGGKVANWGLFRRILSKFANFYSRIVTGVRAADLTAGFMALKKDLLLKIDLPNLKSFGYSFLVEIKYAAWFNQARLKEIPIVFSERKQGGSKLNSKILFESFLRPIALAKFRSFSIFLGILIFLLSFSLYAATAPSTIYLGDSAEFIGVVKTFGIAHPPGYPTYVVLAKIFSFLPLGSFEYRVALFSSLAASISLVFVYLILVRLSKQLSPNFLFTNNVAAFLITLGLGISDIFWSQAIMAKVYSLFVLFAVIIFFLIFKHLDKPQIKLVYWIMFLFGLGFGVHQTIILFFPAAAAILFFEYKPRFEFRLSLKQLALALMFLVLGSLIYLYLPFSSNLNPEYNWGQPGSSFNAFAAHVLRLEYKSEIIGTSSLEDKVNLLDSFSKNSADQFYWWLILVLPGLFALFQKTKQYFWFLVLSLCSGVLGIILVRNTGWNLENHEYFSFYYLPAYATIAIFIGCGIFALLSYSDKLMIIEKKFFAALVIVLAFALPIFLITKNYERNNLKDFSFLEDYSYASLTHLPHDSVLLTSYDGMATDSSLFGLLYQKWGRKLRPDVIIDYLGADATVEKRREMIQNALKNPNFKDREIYTSFIVDNLDPNWRSVSNGLVYKFATNPDNVKLDTSLDLINEHDKKILSLSGFGRDLMANYYYAQAAALIQQGKLNKSQQAFVEAINFDNQLINIDYNAYIALRSNY